MTPEQFETHPCRATDATLVPGYKLELVITGAMDRIFCAGANIPMLAGSAHGFKVNFCKFSNETRLPMEDSSAHSGQRYYIAACNGTTAGGGDDAAFWLWTSGSTGPPKAAVHRHAD